MSSPPRDGAELGGRPFLRGMAIGVGCLLLIVFFAVLQFPWERLRPSAIVLLERGTGAQVELADLAMGWSWTGPTMTTEGLVLTWPGMDPLRVDAAELGPALSFSWLSGEPALTVDLALAGGTIRGTVWPLGEIGFDGDFAGLLGSALPLPPGTDTLPLDGVLSGEADLRRRAGVWQGDLRLAGEDGSLLLPGVPIAIPFDQVEIEVHLDEGGAITIHQVRLDGPMASFDASGTIGAGASLELAPLALDVDLRGVASALQDSLRSQGIPLDGSGNGRATISGSLSRPILR